MSGRWTDISPDADQKQEHRFQDWLAGSSMDFHDAQCEASYQERAGLIMDAIQLKRPPNRIPACPSPGFFPVEHAGLTLYDAMYDYEQLDRAWRGFYEEFDPDGYFAPTIVIPGKVMDILDLKLYQWPGHGVSRDRPYQFVEGEYMKEGEYQELIDDPTGFFIRVYLPRVFGSLKGLEKMGSMPPPPEIITIAGGVLPFSDPPVQKAVTDLVQAGSAAAMWFDKIRAINRAVQGRGVPSLSGGVSKAPFDFIGDSLRGTAGIMMDMYQHPEELLEACERIVPLMVRRGVSSANANRHGLVFMPLHKGADGFMSDRHFRTFYWPTLRKVIIGLINEGCVPLLFAEGGYHSRLEVISDVPKGKTVWWFEDTDMGRAKETVGRAACIAGNVPLSLLFAGTPGEVEAYCKDLIRRAGKDGGFILSTSAGMSGSKPANVKTMIDCAKKYGALFSYP